MSYDQWRLVVVGALTAVTAYSLVGIVAVWTAVGRSHWFQRIATVLLLAASWLLVGDGGLCLMFLTQSVVIILGLRSFRNRLAQQPGVVPPAAREAATEPNRLRFSLAQLALAFILISGLLAIMARVRTATFVYWYTSVIPGIMLGMLTLASASAVLLVRNSWLRLAAIILDFPAVLVGAWLWLAQPARSHGRRTVCAVALLLIAFLPAAFFLRQFAWYAIAFPTPLADNGYRDLLEASNEIKSQPPDIDRLSDADLRSYVARNHASLKRAEQALARPCQAILTDSMNEDLLLAELHQFEDLSRLLAAASRVELADGRVDDAAEHSLAVIRLGASVAQGGVMAHDAIGGLIEQTGVEEMQKAVSQLDDETCRDLTRRLMAIDARREPIDTLMRREVRYVKEAYPWKHRLWAMAPDAPRDIDRHWRSWFTRKRAHLRLLACHLALRQRLLATGAWPDSLQHLVPQYLPEVPLDPFSDHPLVYHKRPQGYRLYSVGYDGLDDGGKAAPPVKTTRLPTGDLVIDPLPAAQRKSDGRNASVAESQ